MARPKKIKGLGDVVATVTDAFGIEQCDGCKQRQDKLNKLVPFGTKELTEPQKQYLQSFFETEHKELTKEEQKELTSIYIDAYGMKKDFEVCFGCSGVWKTIISKLKRLDYEN